MGAINSVTFRGNVQIGPFQTVHIEASASVGPREKPELVLHEVKTFVARELTRAKTGTKPRPQPAQGKFGDMLQTSDDTWERRPWDRRP